MKNSLSDYRTGGVGALLDEYERAVEELKTIIQSIGEEKYFRIADTETENEECRSIQTMMSHIVDAGYAYANDLRPLFLMNVEPYQFKIISYQAFNGEVDKMFAYTVETLEGKLELSYAEIDEIVYISPSGYKQDLEQILEHAIVHILRHRRQTEKFLLKFESEKISN
ncbi:MAG TPA: DinB family protein [Pyrinomonadaceae bacterium]|nr:DinB family protein [Pyrinomonadaceae bacterium]